MIFTDLLLIFLSIYFLWKSQNLLFVFLSIFTLLYGINVLIVSNFLKIPFSNSQNKFDSFNYITLSLLVFLIIAWFAFGKIKLYFKKLPIKKKISLSDIITGGLIIAYGIYLYYEKGFRLQGQFLEYAGKRSILEDYVALLFLIFFLYAKASRLLVFAFLFIASSYLIAGERMRMFIYLGAVAVYLYRHRLGLIKIALLFAYFFAEFISLSRSQTNFGLKDNGEFVSHFGAVTISSLYLNDFTNNISVLAKVKYYLGILIGNAIPSSLLPNGFNIRDDLFSQSNIPGGGWVTAFILSTSNWYVYIATALIICLFIRKMMIRESLFSNYFIFVLLITSPRWFMYSPYLIFRFAIYASIILLFIKSIETINKKYD